MANFEIENIKLRNFNFSQLSHPCIKCHLLTIFKTTYLINIILFYLFYIPSLSKSSSYLIEILLFLTSQRDVDICTDVTIEKNETL